MKRRSRTALTRLFLLFGLALSACSAAQASNNPTTSWPDGQEQQDTQGVVEVAITPLNLNNPSGTLVFDVSLNTHTVDLSMDLATLATLKTDSGLLVKATLWEAPSGGHHVAGKLSFPATVDRKPVLDGANKLFLDLQNLEVPERVFSWER